MTAVCYHFTTSAASTNLQPVRALQSANFKGYVASNASTTAPSFLKLYWYTESGSTEGPTVGTTVPNMTIPLNPAAVAGNGQSQSWPDGITGNGQLWVAVTGAAADNDNSNAAAVCVITLLIE